MQRGGISKHEIILGNMEVKAKAKAKLRIPIFKVNVPVKVKKEEYVDINSNKGTQHRRKVIKLYTNLYNTHIHECTYCGDDIDSRDSFLYTIDHIVAHSLGGADRIENLRPCCRECNLDKDRLTLEEWLNILMRQYDNSEGLNSLLLYKIMRVQLVKRYVDRMGKLLYR